MPSEMREPTFWILTALAEGPRHGYALLDEVVDLSDGRVRLKIPTLYAALSRLGSEGAVEQDREEVVDGRLRRYFRLTPSGAARLEQEINRMETTAAQARRRLAAKPSLGQAR